MRTENSGALKFLYPVIVRITGLSGIVILILSFLVFPRSTNTMELDEEVQIIIEQIDIPQTEQFDQPPPPARPSVPVESESEENVEAALNVAMASGTWNSLNWSRAFNSIEHKEIYEKSNIGMASYVTTMQAAEDNE